jgi:REP element-mobilizing transposase RayT
MDALKRLNDEGRIELIAAVVMPDHIHFAARLQDTGLSSRMHSLKSYTSNKINPLLGRDGALWESQYYDHAIRTEDELNERVNYCLQKPVRRRLVERFEDYPQWYCAYKV